ncbi:RNI-like protein [Phlebopus sp. FC_14]|nr:RNI-like protein [Phlebopus sp. FC_14]
MSRNNNVRGPTSALTEFLRESGINPATIARRAATQNQNQNQNQNNASSAAGSSTGNNDMQADNGGDGGEQAHEEGAVPEASSSRRRRDQPSGYTSDQLDEPEEESPVKKRKSGKGKATAAAKAKAKKKAKEDGDYEGSSEDEYRAVSKSLWSMGGNGNPKPPVGSFENCARCEKQFTVTKYTMAANPPPGYLCHPCTKASGVDPFKKPAVPRKRKPAEERREVVSYEALRFPTLAAICIQLISKYIDDVEALGDIGSVNMDELAKALAKNRGLTPENAQLFYDVQNKRLRFYDATNLTPPALTTLANLNPNLTHLHLDFCGRLTCEVVNYFSKSLPHLTHISLLGPFLVRAEAWIQFFKSKPELRSFRITQSPRFDLACAQEMVKHCTKLEELQLREVGLLDDTFTDPLCELPPLRLLDLAQPSIGIEEADWLRLLERHGRKLENLNPSWHGGFTDDVLENGVKKHARFISELRLDGCANLTDGGVAKFFRNWAKPNHGAKDEDKMDIDTAVPAEPFTPNPPLHVLSLARNHTLSSAALDAAIAHSASSLNSLNLNGLRSMSTTSLARLKGATSLRWLDVSWCREMDDFVMKDVVQNAKDLGEVRVWGCNRVRGAGWAGKRGLKIHGIEPNAGA